MARIEFLPGRVRCPLAGVGTRADNASNRLVVDDPATAIDITGTTITLTDDRDCAPKTVIADLVWLAEGISAAGARVPFTVHLEVTKTGHAFAIDLHTHEPPHLPRAQVSFEPYEVVAVDRGVRTVLVDVKRLARTAAYVPLSRRLSAAVTTTRDHLAGVAQQRITGYRALDRSIGLGALGRGMMLIRATLTALSPPPTSRSLAELLRAGSWELALTALTDRWLPELVQRDLVLFGIADVPVLAPLAAGQLTAGHVLAFRFGPDGGEVRLDGASSPLPAAHDLAREYLEFHMLGGMIAAAVA